MYTKTCWHGRTKRMMMEDDGPERRRCLVLSDGLWLACVFGVPGGWRGVSSSGQLFWGFLDPLGNLNEDFPVISISQVGHCIALQHSADKRETESTVL
jgi:hypothetical protein